jgi:predicted nucleic acid-binding Zn ribbon protein
VKQGRPRRPTPEPLGRALEELVTRRRWAGRLDGARIFDLWPEVAGEEIAAHARPVRLHGGVLVVGADDAGWATQLRYLAGELQARANSLMGPDTVRKVQIVVDRSGTGV